jgi:hypothetical protein
MIDRMNRAEARAWKERWQLVNTMEIEELRMTSLDVKLQQLCSMMALARELGWTERRAEGEDEVRERWNRLRKAYGG